LITAPISSPPADPPEIEILPGAVRPSIGPLIELAGLVPGAPEIIAAADMRDGIGKPAIDKTQPRGREARPDRDAICAVAVEVERAGTFTILAHDHADRNLRPIARGNLQPLRFVKPGIVARGDFLHFERNERAIRDMVIERGARADHAFIAQPQRVHRPFGVVAEAGLVARFGERDRFDA